GQPAIAHLEYTDFVGRAKAVLHGTQNAELMAAFAFEIKHCIDHVLEHARTGDDTLLGHMADQDQHKAAAFGEAYQLLRGPAHLAHRAGGSVQGVEIHSLDRIDDHQTGRV